MWSSLLEKCRKDSYRRKYITSFFTLSKKTTRKPLKVAPAKKYFSNVCIIEVYIISSGLMQPPGCCVL